MIFNYVVSKVAEKDISDIVDYILQDSVQAADKFVDGFYDTMRMLSFNPKMGCERKDLTRKEVRFWVYKKNYLIVYREKEPIEIIRVLSRYRDVVSLLIEDESTVEVI